MITQAILSFQDKMLLFCAGDEGCEEVEAVLKLRRRTGLLARSSRMDGLGSPSDMVVELLTGGPFARGSPVGER